MMTVHSSIGQHHVFRIVKLGLTSRRTVKLRIPPFSRAYTANYGRNKDLRDTTALITLESHDFSRVEDVKRHRNSQVIIAIIIIALLKRLPDDKICMLHTEGTFYRP